MITLLNKFDDNYVIEEDDILNIVNQYIRELNLEEYLNDVIFNDLIPDIASYSPTESIIYINMKKLWESCYKFSNKAVDVYKFNYDCYSYLLNYYCLYILFHELEHVMQKKKHDKLYRDNNSVYLFLYELNRQLQIENKDLYDRCHDLFPMEIEANNQGLLHSYNLMSRTKLPSREKRILHIHYINSLLANYVKVNKYHIDSPFSKLHDEEKRINIALFNKLLDESKLNKIERLNLGLDITPHEYKGLQREKLRLLIKR